MQFANFKAINMFLSYTHAVFLAAVLFCCAHGMLISYTICAPQKNDLRIFYFFAGLHQSIEQCGCIYRSSLSPNSVLKSIPPGEKVQDPHNPCIQYVCAVCAHACTSIYMQRLKSVHHLTTQQVEQPGGASPPVII